MSEKSPYSDIFYAVLVLFFNPLTTSVPHHIETTQLICFANQLTGFYMMRNTGLQWVKTTLSDLNHYSIAI